MLKRGDYLMIQHKHDDGVYIKDIAEVHTNNVIAPPAGVWLASRQSADVTWEITLMFTPGVRE